MTAFSTPLDPLSSSFNGPASSASTARPYTKRIAQVPVAPPNRQIIAPRPLPKPSSLAGTTRTRSPPLNCYSSPPNQNSNSARPPPTSVLSGTRRASPSNVASPHSNQNNQGASVEELAAFASLCRERYFDNSQPAALKVDEILAKLPAGSRTAYARTMARVRSAYHVQSEIKRRNLVERVLAESLPGQQVMRALQISEGGTASMRSKRARQERLERLSAFIKKHLVVDMPGTQPFFRSLYAALYLQGISMNKGGAASRRVEWTVNLDVFTEAGGDEWTRDAVGLLKSVLGCVETVRDPPPESYFTQDEREELQEPTIELPTVVLSSDSDDSESDEDVFDEETCSNLTNASSFPDLRRGPVSIETALAGLQSSQKRQPPKIPPHRIRQTFDDTLTGSARSRSISDPFLDPLERERRTSVSLEDGPLATSYTSVTPPSVSQLGTSTRQRLLSSSPPSPLTAPALPLRPSVPAAKSQSLTPTESPIEVLESPPEKHLIFTFPPYLTNPELRQLARTFPPFVKKRSTVVRSFSDEGLGVTPREMETGLSSGHGEIRIGSATREAGWEGTALEKFLFFWRKLFRRD